MKLLSGPDVIVMGIPQPKPNPAVLIAEQLQRLTKEDNTSAPLVTAAQALLRASSVPQSLPPPDVEIDSDELDLTWRANGKMLRLITYPSKPAKVYFHVDSENPFTRGCLVDADAASLSEKLDWLAA